MTSKEAIEKIKRLIKFDTTESVKFENAKLADGTIIQWEGDLGEGTPIMVVAEDGNTIPAPDATHVLENSTMVTTVGGLVTKIETKKAEVEVEVEASEFELQFTAHLETFNSFIERFNAMEAKLAEITAATKTVNESVESKFAKVIELVEAISSEPAVVVEPAKNITYKKTPNKQSAVELFKVYQNQIK